MCLPPKAAKGAASKKPAPCVKQWSTIGHVIVSCAAGKLSLTMAEERGYMLGDAVDVVATCENSAFTSLSSCTIANAANTTVTAVAGGVEVSSSEWDEQCVCGALKRRPVIKLAFKDIIAGAACQG